MATNTNIAELTYGLIKHSSDSTFLYAAILGGFNAIVLNSR